MQVVLSYTGTHSQILVSTSTQCNFQRLEVFDARSSTLTHNTLTQAHFAALPTLRTCRFSIGAEELKIFVDSGSSGYIFMELADFNIETDGLEEAARLIEQKGFGRLEHLTVCVSSSN